MSEVDSTPQPELEVEDRETGGPWKTSRKTWNVVKSRARQLRREMTPAERKLWSRIRLKRLGVKFRRQMSVNRFITDFYSADARLLIEVDGAVHFHQVEEDASRQAFLERTGLRVIRFTNEQVMNAIEDVLANIASELERRVVR